MEDRWAPWACGLLARQRSRISHGEAGSGLVHGQCRSRGKKSALECGSTWFVGGDENYKEGEIEIRIKSSKVLYMGIEWSVFSLRSFLEIRVTLIFSCISYCFSFMSLA